MTTTLAGPRAQRVLLRVPDLSVRQAEPPAAPASSVPELQRQLWNRPKAWSGWVSWTQRFRQLPWQFQVSLVAIVLGGAIIVAARLRPTHHVAPRQPSPINILGDIPPRVNPAPTVVSEVTVPHTPLVAPSPEPASSPAVADDRMAHRVFAPHKEPGVAEFEGSISSPILEANHDSARPGIH